MDGLRDLAHRDGLLRRHAFLFLRGGRDLHDGHGRLVDRGLHLLKRGAEFFDHVVDGLAEGFELVLRPDVDAAREVARCDETGGV